MKYTDFLQLYKVSRYIRNRAIVNVYLYLCLLVNLQLRLFLDLSLFHKLGNVPTNIASKRIEAPDDTFSVASAQFLAHLVFAIQSMNPNIESDDGLFHDIYVWNGRIRDTSRRGFLATYITHDGSLRMSTQIFHLLLKEGRRLL